MWDWTSAISTLCSVEKFKKSVTIQKLCKVTTVGRTLVYSTIATFTHNSFIKYVHENWQKAFEYIHRHSDVHDNLQKSSVYIHYMDLLNIFANFYVHTSLCWIICYHQHALIAVMYMKIGKYFSYTNSLWVPKYTVGQPTMKNLLSRDLIEKIFCQFNSSNFFSKNVAFTKFLSKK